LLADAPRWMLVIIGIWWQILLVIFVILQRKGRCIDTYQAIWGDKVNNPGSKLIPIGFGIKKYTAKQWQEKFLKDKDGVNQ